MDERIIETYWNWFQDGTLTAEQALRMIAIDAGLVEISDEAKAIRGLIVQVAEGNLSPAVLIAAVEA